MAIKIIGFACFIFYFINIASSQCLNRFSPQNLLPVAEPMLPNQLLLNQPFVPTTPNIYNMDVPYHYDYPNTVQAIPAMPAATIIQDSTVSNNLANALQLLVVSNLLRNTLFEDTLPNYAPVDIPLSNYGGYNYVY